MDPAQRSYPPYPGEPQPLVPPPEIVRPPYPSSGFPRARPLTRDRIGVHLGLLILTFITTTWIGAEHYGGFLLDFVPRPLVFTTRTDLVLGGLWYSLTILAILGAHEMGHYLACRYYRIDASLPFFLPMVSMVGTLGAFIRIRSRIGTKVQLFDVGVAGPIAGFVLAVPAMFLGLSMSRVVPLPPNFVGWELGEPLLFQLAARLIWGPIPDGYSLNLHPMAFAAWFGLLATALNLFPIGQLDGGHISYAVLGRRSTYVTIGTIAAAILLTFFSMSWLLWVVLMVVLLLVFGPRHPSTADEEVPLDRARLAVAAFVLLMFIACFTPAPIEPYELIRPR